MRRTEQQRQTISVLFTEYGQPDRLMNERTKDETGVIWLRWHNTSLSSQFPDRNLFIRPDGSRMTWELQY